MKTIYSLLSMFLLIQMSALTSYAQDQEPIVLKPCFIDSISQKSQCTTVKMPIDHRGNASGEVEIFVAVLPPLSSQVLDDPLVIFSGGPGQAVSEMGGFVKSAFKFIREHRAIILIDQRGTGKSTPMRCELEDDDSAFDPLFYSEAIKECRAQYDFPAQYFTMENIVEDQYQILKRLGYEKVNLWGVSWGTRTAVHYLRRHPEHVRSVIVDGVLPPEVAVFKTSAANATRALAKMNEACLSDDLCATAYGDINEVIGQLVVKAEKDDLIFKGSDPLTGDLTEQNISKMNLVQNIRGILYTPHKVAMLPMALHRLNQGDGRAFIALTSDGGLSSKSMYLGSTLSLLCGEEVSRVTAEEATAIGEGHFTYDSYHRFWAAACQGWPSLAGDDDIHTAYISDVPMVVLSGELDPITPPSMGEQLAKSYKNSKHFIVKGAGHNISYLGCVPKILAEFVKDLDVSLLDDKCLDKMRRPDFRVPDSDLAKEEAK